MKVVGISILKSKTGFENSSVKSEKIIKLSSFIPQSVVKEMSLTINLILSIFLPIVHAYSHSYTHVAAGDYIPLKPPSHEITHLKSIPFPNKIPPTSFLSTSTSTSSTRRKLLGDEDAAAGLEPQKVPHNWFGADPYVAPKYAVMSGKEECNVCKAMLDAASKETTVALPIARSGSEATPAEPTSPAAVGANDLCASVKINYKTTCKSYSTFLSSCPSFVHNICHEDIGGSERLRSPCPRHLVCYYCLRINPIHCLDYLDEDQ